MRARGKAKYTAFDQNEYFLEVEINELVYPGVYEVHLFKDYYSNFVAGTIEIDDEGNGKAIACVFPSMCVPSFFVFRELISCKYA
jgi:hypothetical protein